ncbi:MAG: DUF305 domain-containing protein [Gemmatimonadota bacterium]|nr:DUF305 domain-containing protein [Gemmatimonadota bacterium]
MTQSHSRRVSATLVAAIALTACSSAPREAARTAPQPATSGQSDSAAIAKARADSARYPYTAADIHFMSGMISHHAQALVMARWALTHDASPAVRRLAERIVNGQEDEIATMQRWLRDRRQPVPEARPTGMRMIHEGVEHDMLMPGMLTEEQMKQLDEARGAKFDELFLTFMIQHHKGAVAMVKDLFGSYGAGQDETVFKFASDVNVDQSTEIERMQKMLASLKLGIPIP